jgi:ribonuclease HII
MICGIDEAGRGPVLGPLVVAGVLLEDEKRLVDIKVKDSKRLSEKRRENLAREIIEFAEIELVAIPAFELDILRQNLSLNKIEAMIFTNIIKMLKPEQVYVDCVDSNEETFEKNLLKRLDYKPDLISKHRADDIYLVVSAASIIAKTNRDKEIKRISEELGKNIGSGYPSDPVTIDFINIWLKEHKELPPYTRNSWKTSERLWDDYKFQPRTLDEF